MQTANGNKKQLDDLRTVVAFGGGTGLGRLLSALASLDERLTGVVATTDDGGSTGRLREATGAIAWGDLRNCFNQICHDEPTLARLLFEYRFVEAGELSGHNLGNLMLLALDQLTARPLDAINLVRGFLGVRPRLLPMSEAPTSLQAEAPSGEHISGETAVDRMTVAPARLWLEPAVVPPDEVLAAIEAAEMIILGPGSFITSVMPSLLVPAIRDVVARARCPRVLVANLRGEDGPTGQLTLAQQLQWMEQIVGARLVDAVLWPASRPLLQRPGQAVFTAELAASDGRHDHARLAASLAEIQAALGRA